MFGRRHLSRARGPGGVSGVRGRPSVRISTNCEPVCQAIHSFSPFFHREKKATVLRLPAGELAGNERADGSDRRLIAILSSTLDKQAAREAAAAATAAGCKIAIAEIIKRENTYTRQRHG